MYIALFIWPGTLAPAIQFYDVIDMGMLYLKFRELKINTFTRKPLEKT